MPSSFDFFQYILFKRAWIWNTGILNHKCKNIICYMYCCSFILNLLLKKVKCSLVLNVHTFFDLLYFLGFFFLSLRTLALCSRNFFCCFWTCRVVVLLLVFLINFFPIVMPLIQFNLKNMFETTREVCYLLWSRDTIQLDVRNMKICWNRSYQRLTCLTMVMIRAFAYNYWWMIVRNNGLI